MRRALADILRRLANRLDPPAATGLGPGLSAYVAAAEARMFGASLAEYDDRPLPRNPRWRAYPRATWRSTSRVDPACGMAALTFYVEGRDAPLRLLVPAETLGHLAETCDHFLRLSGDHSEKSSGRPQSDGSMPEEGQGT